MAFYTPAARTYPETAARATSPRKASRTSSTTLWTIQGLLALTFLFAGISKLVMSA